MTDQARRERLEERFERILRAEGAALARTAASYAADPAQAEDLLQEIRLAVWLALPRFRGDASERTFVFRIAHNRGLSHAWRRRSATAGGSEAIVELRDPKPGPESEAADRQRHQRLLSSIRALPLSQRQILVLRLEGLSYREIAEILGITENAAGVRWNRARRALKALMESEGSS